jgi:hypothetical protein
MYNKLFGKILDSSIWLEDHATIRVWITLLASMDEDGFCQYAALGNLANRASVTLEEAQHAVGTLEGPDPDSNDPDNEGRRIERVQGGWVVLNAVKYREMVTRQVIKEGNRLRMQKFRASKKSVSNGEVGLAEYAEGVANKCGISDRRVKAKIADALESYSKTNDTSMEEATKFMIDQFEKYNLWAHRMKYTVSPGKFFAQGIWLNENLWPIENQRL